jgi:hypothetical protein
MSCRYKVPWTIATRLPAKQNLPVFDSATKLHCSRFFFSRRLLVFLETSFRSLPSSQGGEGPSTSLRSFVRPRRILAVVFLWHLSRGGEWASTSLRSVVRATMHAGGCFPVVPAARFGETDELTSVSRFDDGVPLSRSTAAAPPTTILLYQHQVTFLFSLLFAWLLDLDFCVSMLCCVPSTVCLFILMCSSFRRLLQASARRE